LIWSYFTENNGISLAAAAAAPVAGQLVPKPMSALQPPNTSTMVPAQQLNVGTEALQQTQPPVPSASPIHTAGPSNPPDIASQGRLPPKQVWLGALAWSGTDPMTRIRKEMKVEVRISSAEASVTEMCE
jgi:hypothetical protein